METQDQKIFDPVGFQRNRFRSFKSSRCKIKMDLFVMIMDYGILWIMGY